MILRKRLRFKGIDGPMTIGDQQSLYSLYAYILGPRAGRYDFYQRICGVRGI